MIEGALIFAVGALLGVLIRSLPPLRRTPRPPTCSCEHAHAVHDPETRKCLAEIRREHYNKGGTRNGWEYVDCPCIRYDGPEVLASVVYPNLMLEGQDKPGS